MSLNFSAIAPVVQEKVRATTQVIETKILFKTVDNSQTYNKNLFSFTNTPIPFVMTFNRRVTLLLKWLNPHRSKFTYGIDYLSGKVVTLPKNKIIRINGVQLPESRTLSSQEKLLMESKIQEITETILIHYTNKLKEQVLWFEQNRAKFDRYEITPLPRKKTKLPFSMVVYPGRNIEIKTYLSIGEGTYKHGVLLLKVMPDAINLSKSPPSEVSCSTKILKEEVNKDLLSYPKIDLLAQMTFPERNKSFSPLCKESKNIWLVNGIKGIIPTNRNYIVTKKKGGRKLILVQPFMQEGNLLELSIKHKIEWVNLLQIFFDMASTLNRLHEKGFVHLDLKMENILIKYDQTYRALLTDVAFLQKVQREKKLDVEGTIAYFPPEVLKLLFNPKLERTPKILCDPKREIWSLAVLFFMVYLDKEPYWVEAMDNIFNNLNNKNVKKLLSTFEEETVFNDPKTCESTKNDLLTHLIWEMFFINPEKRPSAKQVLDRLKEIAKIEKIELIDD